MDLPDIGHTCDAPLCGDRDFLPIKCPGCSKLFCRFHASFDGHECPSAQEKSDFIAGQEDVLRRERCGVQNCSKPTMESLIVDTTEPERRVVALCQNCDGAFCAVYVYELCTLLHFINNFNIMLHPQIPRICAFLLILIILPRKPPSPYRPLLP